MHTLRHKKLNQRRRKKKLVVELYYQKERNKEKEILVRKEKILYSDEFKKRNGNIEIKLEERK